jgi:hypothetical protein
VDVEPLTDLPVGQPVFPQPNGFVDLACGQCFPRPQYPGVLQVGADDIAVHSVLLGQLDRAGTRRVRPHDLGPLISGQSLLPLWLDTWWTSWSWPLTSTFDLLHERQDFRRCSCQDDQPTS